MTIATPLSPQHRRGIAGIAAVPLFATALFGSAFLLFAIQPMFAKMVLPALGGAPSVWSVAMVFFQAALLAGYTYAHILTRFLAPAAAVAVHVALMAVVALIALPIALSPVAGEPPAGGAQALWVLSVFALSTGLPFFAVSANAPLLQAWFARTDGAGASNPYVLYGASNLGSFAALLAYPTLIEPFLTLSDQSAAWSRGFVLLGAVIACAGGLVVLSGRGFAREAVSAPNPAAAIRWSARFRWILLAFVPSAYLVAVTAHITTDLAAAPFLWVLPLSLFLLTFVLVFREGRERIHEALSRLLPFAIVLLLVIGGMGSLIVLPIWVTLVLHVGAFFLVALVAHGHLYRERPAAGDLTEFYLWMSFGGVLGGIFTGLLAPLIFNTVAEYPILMVAALACASPVLITPTRRDVRVFVLCLTVGAALMTLFHTDMVKIPPTITGALYMLTALVLLLTLWTRRDLALLTGLVAAVLLVRSALLSSLDGSVSVRSFFGVHRVSETIDGRFRMLSHGTTVHGVERIRSDSGDILAGRPRPLAYYGDGGPFEYAIDAIRAERGGRLQHVGLVGLGTGALACRAEPGETWRFYEIDAEVVRIARDPQLFRALSACGPVPEVVLGDARLTLARASAPYDMLILDAFTSDAIPVHLLTREAFDTYLSKLKTQGTILFHISNRHMDLAPEIARVAAEHDMVTLLGERRIERDLSGTNEFQAPTRLLVIAREEARFGTLLTRPDFRRVPVDRSARPWTDDFSNILGPIWRHYTGGANR